MWIIRYICEGEFLPTEPGKGHHGAGDSEALSPQSVDEAPQDHQLHVVSGAAHVDRELACGNEHDEDHRHEPVPYDGTLSHHICRRRLLRRAVG
jgi:hypothetical protein